MNNVEQVYVENPATGNWTIRIKGTSVPQGPQKYSLVSSLDIGAPPVGSARMRIAHTIADAPAVDVYVDGEMEFAATSFKDVTTYASLTAGGHPVQVVPAGEMDLSQSIFSETVTLSAMDYTLAAMGTLTTTDGFAHHLHLYEDNNTAPASGQAHVRFVHASPGAPAVDIALAGVVTPLISNVPYMGASDYEIVDVGTYPLEVRSAGSSQIVLDLGETALERGVYTEFAVGPLANLEAVLSADRLIFEILLPAILRLVP